MSKLDWWVGVGALALAASCVRVPNPHYVADGDSGSETFADDTGSDSQPGDGDTGDGDGDTGHGKGDSGDGDTGDGDGDTDCEPGMAGCPCGVLESCEPGLACVLGDCIEADSCGPVNDAVQVSAVPTYMMGVDPPMLPATFICVLNGQDQGNKAVLNVEQCGAMELLQGLVIEVQPKVAPIEELLGNPNLAATVTVVEEPEGFFVRIEANGMDLYYIDGTSLVADGITEYPWEVEPFSSSCGTTPTMCGEVERLAMLIDGGVVFDGNAEQASEAATAWIETNVDECGGRMYELVLLAY
ncbi:hypothetical protein ENSA5_05650 [Enhygromyxa salina]|uniref:Uncharacterized protein n=1 Tax=Enhygromyxa salina TaxID=215803 RepID=A0A2S9YI04_9BACT|nr:hypothetical protein [Enhygromyxa salina]PRQ04691.1 hypothetical protein ENSA5_05650 [Enhygromyxa salina]